MTRRFTIALVALVALAAMATLATAPVQAHPGHEHKVLGTVTMAASDHVMLKDKDGKDVTVRVNRETRILKDKKPMTIADVRAGMRVVATVVTEKDQMIAKTIELGAAPAAK